MIPLNSSAARSGLYFGATSGVITTLGLLTGLNSGTGDLAAVLGGILVIAIADAMSDSLGMYLAEKSDTGSDGGPAWIAPLATFATKFLFAVSFVVPLLLLPLDAAVVASVCWGLVVISVLSYLLARERKESPLLLIAEHVGLAIVVLLLSHQVGVWISAMFS